MRALYSSFDIDSNAEITFEANPDDIDELRLITWKQNGINRLSIGIQSFFKEDLVWMNRAHNDAQALECISLAQDEGFDNMSIDLIYGTPTLTDEHWMQNMQTAVSLNVPHLSCYALTVEPGTALDSMTRKKKVLPVNSDDQARQFMMMTEFLAIKRLRALRNLQLFFTRKKKQAQQFLLEWRKIFRTWSFSSFIQWRLPAMERGKQYALYQIT